MKKPTKRITPDKPIKLELTYADLSKLSKFPWPYKDASVEEFSITDVFHYIPALDRGKFMEELYRVMTDGGKCIIVCAYYSTMLAYADFHLEWPPVCEQSFLYFNKGWREANKLPYTLKCDFDFSYGYIPNPDLQNRNAETQSFQIKSYLNTVQRLQVALTKRPEGQ